MGLTTLLLESKLYEDHKESLIPIKRMCRPPFAYYQHCIDCIILISLHIG